MNPSGPAPKARVLCNLRLPAVEGYSLRCFGDYLPAPVPGASPPPPWRAEMERRDLADILPLIPAAERPDILVCASPEYLPIPWDVRAFPGPKVLLITDWNVCLRFLPDLCPLFDFCFTDWPGYRLLRKAGVANVFHQPLFGHDPERFRVLGGGPGAVSGGHGRTLDVSFCGNLNAGLHGERNRLLARVARWAHRTGRPVHLRQAFDDAYIDVLNRSRLVFNYSIRGEANMRLFEAMACGAVPLVEETNQEVAILFQENRHYFRYPMGGLEAKLDELLARPERIAEAAAEAQREVGRFTKAKQLEALLDAVGREGTSGSAGTEAKHGTGVSSASRNTLAKIRVLGMGYTAPEALREIQARKEENPGLDLEATPGLLAALIEKETGNAAALARQALLHLTGEDAWPPFLRRFFLLQDARRTKDWVAVERLSRECLEALERADVSGLRPGGALYSTLLHPVDLGKGMNSDVNRAFLEDLTGKGPGGKGLLSRHCAFALAESALERGSAAEALALAQRLDASAGVSLPLQALKTEAGLKAGDFPAVQGTCRDWFEAAPLDTRAWEGILTAYDRTGMRAERRRFLEDIHTISLFLLDPDQSDRIARLIHAA